MWSAERTSLPTQRSWWTPGGGHEGHADEAEVVQPVNEEADHHLQAGQEDAGGAGLCHDRLHGCNAGAGGGSLRLCSAP